jgi:hypothetical protein
MIADLFTKSYVVEVYCDSDCANVSFQIEKELAALSS